MSSTIVLPERPRPSNSIIYHPNSTKLQRLLVKANDQGLPELIFKLWEVDYLRINTAGPMKGNRRTDIINKVGDIVCSIKSEWLDQMLSNQLYKNFENGELEDPLDVSTIYTLVLCNLVGRVPDKTQLTAALEVMKKYVQHLPERMTSVQMDDIDNICNQVNEASPYRMRRLSRRGGDMTVMEDRTKRDWLKRQVGQTRRDWEYKNGTRLNHPRRYCSSPVTRTKMESFIEKCKPRIQNAGDDDWSLVYVGWSKGPLERKDNHYSHGDGSNQVGRLLEAILFVLYPEENFFLRFMSVCTVWYPGMVDMAEHVVSQLNSSYIRWGGLNMMNAGGQESRANNLDEDYCIEGGLDVYETYAEPLSEIALQYNIDSTLRSFMETGSEVVAQQEEARDIEDMKNEFEKATEDVLIQSQECFELKIKMLEDENKWVKHEIECATMAALLMEFEALS